ncbi:MAG: carboxypeptidase-like regulatory domain-containing protein, partial [Bacteroidota bacterium]
MLGLQIAMAQMTVSGTVTDTDTKEPLEGVAVLIKGTTIGMFTNSEGKYELEVPSDGAVLLFTFVGKQTVEEPINGRTSI